VTYLHIENTTPKRIFPVCYHVPNARELVRGFHSSLDSCDILETYNESASVKRYGPRSLVWSRRTTRWRDGGQSRRSLLLPWEYLRSSLPLFSPERLSPNIQLVQEVPPLAVRAVMSRLRSSRCRHHPPCRVPHHYHHHPLHHRPRPHRLGNRGGNSLQSSRRSSPR